MESLTQMSNQRVAVVAACLAVTVALLFFLSAVWSGASMHQETQTDVDHQKSHVRYVMNYAVEAELYSFYKQNDVEDVAVSDASDKQ